MAKWTAFLDFMVHQRAKLFPGLFSGLLIVTNSVSQVLVKDINWGNISKQKIALKVTEVLAKDLRWGP